MNIDFGTISNVIVQTVCAEKELRTMNALLHCHLYGSPRRTFLDRVSSSVDFHIKTFVLVTCVICYCMVTLDSTCTLVVSSQNVRCILSIKQNVLKSSQTKTLPSITLLRRHNSVTFVRWSRFFLIYCCK